MGGMDKLDQLHFDRLIHPILSFTISIGALVYCELTDADFATYLLYILVANVLTSTIYYVAIMKVRFPFNFSTITNCEC